MVSALNGISTEVETFSRNTVRPFDFLADALERQVGPRKDAAREPLALPNQPKQEVLGLDRNAAELARFVAGEEQHAPRSFRVAFEHPVTYVERGHCPVALYGKGRARPISFSA